jgi:transcription initiation factor TFIID subunit 2
MARVLPAVQRDGCARVTQKLLSCPLSLFFRKPVDPVLDNVPTYLERIRSPMDLGTVLSKLESNRYASVDEWAADVRLVWENAVKFNGGKSTIGVFALDLASRFEEYLAEVPTSEWHQWALRLRRTQAKLAAYLEGATARRVRRPK